MRGVGEGIEIVAAQTITGPVGGVRDIPLARGKRLSSPVQRLHAAIMVATPPAGPLSDERERRRPHILGDPAPGGWRPRYRRRRPVPPASQTYQGAVFQLVFSGPVAHVRHR
jgi:hypothetical protein